MAKLPQSTGGTGLQITELAPQGQHIAVCVRISDQFGVERPSFNDKNIKELVDVTRFVFGLMGSDGRPYLVQTYEFNISGSPGSNLMKFLTQWLGSSPQIGWDYVELMGKGAMLTIQHRMPRKPGGNPYASITGISPVHPQLASHVPPAANFEGVVRALENSPAKSQSGPPPAPPAPGPTRQYPPQPPVAPPVAPPAPPVVPPAASAPPPPPPPAPAASFFVAVNGQAVKVATLAGYDVSTPAIREGETTWSTVGALLGATSQPGVPEGRDEDVPF